DIFAEAGMERLVAKSKLLSGYLHYLLKEINASGEKKLIEVITPSIEEERGCQVSILMPEKGRSVFETLSRQGVVADWREPNVIRVAPVPLYNTFGEVWKFGEIVKRTINSI
ncbi:MAG TPA: kynureninase, partial [Chitinophagaceae bacterium]|nr:kynureninase [Chitinophagaceae bacterium]